MPLYHVGGIVRNLLAPILSETTVLITPGFDASAFWDILHTHSPTWYYAVPSMHMAILDAAAVGSGTRNQGGSVRMIANAGGGMSHGLAVRLREVFEGAVVLPSYGMTECMPIAAPPVGYALERVGCSGVSVGPEIAIKDGTGNTLAPNEFGRITVRGRPLFDGYEGNEEGTKESFTQDGFFDTGDMGYLDPDGYLCKKRFFLFHHWTLNPTPQHLNSVITGRSKEVINRGGEIISPVEIEDAVVSHPSISDAIAFSIPHATLQETIGIAIQCKPHCQRPGLVELQKHVSGTLHLTKWPQVVVYMEYGVPRNRMGKPMRIQLAERLGILEVNDTQGVHDRLFETTGAVDPGSSVSQPIPCTKVVRVSVAKMQGLMDRMPYKRDAFVFCETAETFGVLVSGSVGMSREVVQQYLKGVIPAYDVPQGIVVVGEVPKDADGRVDVERCLKVYEERVREDEGGRLGSVEESVVRIFAEVLGLGRVRKGDDFFEVGGSSLAAGKVSVLVR
ncbi:hypothetical protein HDU98_007072 [Podochytrium sp. JEL0797]|nr:hypothetical protein HDU98_007072 [Podochytrium sp. JEL0797]